MTPQIIPVSDSDYSVLFEIYASSRTEEMKFVPWTDEQKTAFLQSQFQAQQSHYLSTNPNGSFNIIKIEDQTAGRLYTSEFGGEIRIMDITLLPQFRNQGIGTQLISGILEIGVRKQKPVTICLETYNPSQNLFSRLGFNRVSDDGVYCLWERSAEENYQTSKESVFSTAGETL